MEITGKKIISLHLVLMKSSLAAMLFAEGAIRPSLVMEDLALGEELGGLDRCTFSSRGSPL
jgi:hypothetical protein